MAKNDGLVQWVEPKFKQYLPADIEKDALSVLLRLLVAKAKDEHAMMQYRKDIDAYGREITEIVRFVKNHGYKGIDVEKTQYDNSYKALLNRVSNQEIDSQSRPTINREEENIPDINTGNSIIEDLSFLYENNQPDSSNLSNENNESTIVDA